MLKLFAIFTFLLYIGSVRLEEKFDPKKYDYCKIRCKHFETFPHSACNCKLTPPREESDLATVAKFRQIVLDEHNKVRDRVASGRDIKESSINTLAPAASNMMVLKYDMELEYISRCYSRNALTMGHDKCRRTGNDMSSGQNIAYTSNINHTYYSIIADYWYTEVEDLGPTDMDAYPKQPAKDIGHFTQLVWGLTDSVGCSLTFHPKLKFKTRVLCNYASRRGDWKAAGNLVGYPTYQKGDACTACPFGTKCDSNSKYPSLCGEIVPAPTDAPYNFSAIDGSNRIGGDKTVVIFTLFVVMLLH